MKNKSFSCWQRQRAYIDDSIKPNAMLVVFRLKLLMCKQCLRMDVMTAVYLYKSKPQRWLCCLLGCLFHTWTGSLDVREKCLGVAFNLNGDFSFPLAMPMTPVYNIILVDETLEWCTSFLNYFNGRTTKLKTRRSTGSNRPTNHRLDSNNVRTTYTYS